jgi:hypothetical protein
MVDGAVVDAANARTNERKEARMHENVPKIHAGSASLVPDTFHLFLYSQFLAKAPPGVFEPC